MTGIELIVEERKRQQDAEGFNKQHDSQHINNELVYAAIHYASPEPIYLKLERNSEIVFTDCWPKSWNRKWDKKNKHDYIRRLTISAALLAAEIDRIQNLMLEED